MCANLFDSLPAAGSEEQFVQLLERPGVAVERIVSTGQSSPPGFWYDQPRGEWVLLLAGEARLRFEDEPVARELKPGDYVDIAPHRRHRVEWTRPDAPGGGELSRARAAGTPGAAPGSSGTPHA